MPRKAYIADVAKVTAQEIPGIKSIAKGSEDGDLNICFVPSSGIPIEIGLLALDVSEYPDGNTYMISTISENVPEGVNNSLDTVQETSAGMSLPDLVAAISKKLLKLLVSGSRENPVDLDDASDAASDVEMTDDESENYSSDDDWGMDPSGGGRATATAIKLSPRDAAKINQRIRADLRAVKLAGFRIGILNGLKADSVSSMLSISVQVTKLGLSDEAIQAWDLEAQQYIVLLIRYSNGYKDFETIMREAAKSAGVDFRIGFSNKYKPTNLEAVVAFTELAKNAKDSSETANPGSEEHEKKAAGFSNLFISSSLNEFINQTFISLVKIRGSIGVNWLGAKAWYNHNQSRTDTPNSELPEEYYVKDVHESTLPDMLAKDHMDDVQATQISIPLVAAQFSLRYLVRCTEYCLVCHDKIEEQFDALKPYVCSKPLCLYQYMSLGFGPSVEHEIMTQPYVVDLLVSFCYSSAMNQRLREYPTGMSLAVPAVIFRRTNYQASSRGAPQAGIQTPRTSDESAKILTDVKIDINRHEIVFDGSQEGSPVRKGDWVIVTTGGRPADHYRVQDTSLFPTIQLAETAVTQKVTASISLNTPADAPVVATPATTPPPPFLIPATFQVYNQNFDDMDDISKSETIVTLLETLPSVLEMRTYLTQQYRRSEPSLLAWNDRVSPAALGLLRWIIASNRSCIVQVDRCPGQDDQDVAKAKVKLDQRISGISEHWVQFRLAQGAPDKEQKFLNALKAQQANLDPKHPTLFAWHGSPLQNWHSIIRNGLDFKETIHGRAFGHGVYHAIDQNTSVGYAQLSTTTWQGSVLNINSAMSLNEIVNCPSEFISSTPYLVVQHIDWIQCRYLLVQVQGARDSLYGATQSPNPSSTGDGSALEVEQDPKFTARSTTNKAIGVPQCAILTSRSFRVDKTDDTRQNKRRKHSITVDKLSSVAASDSDDMEDLIFLLSDEESNNDRGKGREEELVILGSTLKLSPKTDFVPGSLDQSNLPMLEPPAYATMMATKALNRSLKEVLEVQKKVPLHELGWYIDANLINNVYQWIVELHSFESNLPIAQDMKDAGITSVVLEIRFGKDYPHSPPFVRVIRPRFLPFMNGGGGHVTAGGAMCMELLTNSGWSAVSSIESVLLQVRMAISNLEPKPARLQSQGKQRQFDYGISEAIDAYRRACATHGWQVPPDFGDFGAPGANNFASGSGGS
ncbi:Ubiquitin-conjugating enzyme E2 Q2 [Lachnellula arida]|uniref:Ubiquitin-conjugating enzyme E2 Q2 n=1 Tax=Lachnellula arida TaxID=1316785 RepID=A0A8T9BRG9_9HELO|nr:Ubiquitin-conjugating enzyme E2 Q2 [Lachnellula arida]